MTVTTTRRALLKATPAIAASALLAVPAAARPSDADSAFWRAHAKWAQLRAGWNADRDPDEDAVFERWNDAETDAFKDLALTPTYSAAAILAKHKAAHYDHCLPETFALRAIEDDLMALAAREAV